MWKASIIRLSEIPAIVGQMLDYLDELGIAGNTFVMYSTDNGPHMNSWPDDPLQAPTAANFDKWFLSDQDCECAGPERRRNLIEREFWMHP